MDTAKLIGVSILIPAAAVLAWRARRVPRTREIQLGRVELAMKPRKRFDKPLIATLATTLVGGAILALEHAGMLPGQH